MSTEFIKKWCLETSDGFDEEVELVERFRKLGLTDFQIAGVLKIIDNTCHHCWDNERGCQCWNDE